MPRKSSTARNDNLIIGTPEQVSACLTNLERQTEQIEDLGAAAKAALNAKQVTEATRANVYARLDMAAERHQSLIAALSDNL